MTQLEDNVLKNIRKYMGTNPSQRELEVTQRIAEAMQTVLTNEGEMSPARLAGLILGLSDPNLQKKYEKYLAWLASSVRPASLTPGRVMDRTLTWKGDPEAGRMVLLAEHHAENLLEMNGQTYVRELLACIRSITAGNMDPTGDPVEPEAYRAWQDMGTAISWAGVAREMLGYEQPTPENQRALEEALNALECLRWAGARVDLILRERNNPEPQAARRGRQLYYGHILDESGARKGEFVVIDVRSGDYEVSNNENEASRKLRERQPNAFTWTERARHPSPYLATTQIGITSDAPFRANRAAGSQSFAAARDCSPKRTRAR